MAASNTANDSADEPFWEAVKSVRPPVGWWGGGEERDHHVQYKLVAKICLLTWDAIIIIIIMANSTR